MNCLDTDSKHKVPNISLLGVSSLSQGLNQLHQMTDEVEAGIYLIKEKEKKLKMILYMYIYILN